MLSFSCFWKWSGRCGWLQRLQKHKKCMQCHHFHGVGEGTAGSRITNNVRKVIHFHSFESRLKGAAASNITRNVNNYIHFYGLRSGRGEGGRLQNHAKCIWNDVNFHICGSAWGGGEWFHHHQKYMVIFILLLVHVLHLRPGRKERERLGKTRSKHSRSNARTTTNTPASA